MSGAAYLPNMHEYVGRFISTATVAGPEISVNLRIASPLFRVNSHRQCWSYFSIAAYGSKTVFRHRFVNIAPIYKE